ncbi:MAG: hypothetical protein MR449_03780 [Spirochaetia bacterium]|nr:hypothetical protein [Spirochaetia bacterium]
MKKILVLAAALFIFGTVFAQTASDATVEALDSYQDTATQIIKIEDKYAYLHEKAKSVNIELEYTPLTGEVRLYYTCMAASFDQGEAMNTSIAVYEDFALENKYKHYTYKAKDKVKYFKDDRGMRMATYVSQVIFTR